MSGYLPGLELDIPSPAAPQAGLRSRFESRWRLIGAGLSNIWRFGNLELPAASGRLLLRGPNGTGKTTALEALWPYLLDLHAMRLAAGKARQTSLSSLMREGAEGKRRCGYVWLTLCGPDEGIWSFGVRIQYSDGSSPPVKVIPFCVPGRPLHDLELYATGRAALSSDEFEASISRRGGSVFEDEDAYVSHIAARIFATPNAADVQLLATRLRQVRNPSLLGDVSPQDAAKALRESLPGVAEKVISATAEALAESEETRKAFARDKEAAEALEDFNMAWCSHACDVVRGMHEVADDAAQRVRSLQDMLKAETKELEGASAAAAEARKQVEALETSLETVSAEIEALEKHQAYQDAGRLDDLQTTLAAQMDKARAAADVMKEVAQSVAMEGRSTRRELDQLIQDLGEQMDRVANIDRTVPVPEHLPSYIDRARASLTAGDTTADPGPSLVIRGDAQQLREVAAAWSDHANGYSHQANAATLALIDYKQVESAEKRADDASRVAKDAARQAERASVAAREAETAAAIEASEFLEKVSSWAEVHPHLMTRSESPSSGEEPDDENFLSSWETRDVDELAAAEPGQVLASGDAWARQMLEHAEGLATECRVQAARALRDAEPLHEEAARLRKEAVELRSGRLLPLPRPDWAGPGDDRVGLGAAIDWSPSFTDGHARSLLEATLVAAGLLGASLDESGASTRSWRVEARGPATSPSLADVVTVDTNHPLAEVAAAVLVRIRLAASTFDIEPSHEVERMLVIGRDGTFRAGVLHGCVPGADDPLQLPPSSHIGARQRREAAQARAAVLETHANDLELQVRELEDLADQKTRKAAEISASGRVFPSREQLRGAEARRAETARGAQDAQDTAERSQASAEQSRLELRQVSTEWQDRTRACGLPTERDRLVHLRDHGKATAEELVRAARVLREKLAGRLHSLIARHDEAAVTHRLNQVEGQARVAFQIASSTQTEVRVLQETAGVAIAEVLARRQMAVATRTKTRDQLVSARSKETPTAQAEAAARTKLETTETQLIDAKRKAAVLSSNLRTLLEVPGVADAVFDGPPPPDDRQLLAQTAAKLVGRKTMSKKTVRERADAVRAGLAGIWSLDPGEDHGELLTYVLTHRDASYTPLQAAAHASMLRQRAEQALAASDEKALREFIIGRLPSAIGTAWTSLNDWVDEVNRKMRAAAASSGVGVQVRVHLREDLSAACRTVFELSCKSSDVERTAEQERELSRALQALLQAANGDTMRERVAAAIDVRDWVDVFYVVTRPGGKMQRWTPKTGLSGGERRLVVLAPMLAAVAAGYDRFGDRALRLVALDEVPAEVDDRGREGLARYIAELDLDLVCTSHLWDGCPGAWDGIDAHDLEAGPDGTVVAFPILIRGLEPIPEVTAVASGVVPTDDPWGAPP